jgi:hypothetical protein
MGQVIEFFLTTEQLHNLWGELEENGIYLRFSDHGLIPDSLSVEMGYWDAPENRGLREKLARHERQLRGHMKRLIIQAGLPASLTTGDLPL